MEFIVDVANEAQRIKKRQSQAGHYMQILNLFYECDSDWTVAWTIQKGLAHPWCEGAPPSAKFCWLAWGANRPLKALRLAPSLSCRNQFFFEKPGSAYAGKVVKGPPAHSQYPAHPLTVKRCHGLNDVAREIALYL
jgi:hypothetical protein